MKEEILRIWNGKKTSKETQILKDISFQIYKREVIGFIFDNVREQQCFLKILKGDICFEQGSIYYKNEKIQTEETKEIFQRNFFSILNKKVISKELTIEDSFFIQQSNYKMKYKGKKERKEKIKSIFREFNLFLQPEQLLFRLSILEQNQVEIIKAYLLGYSAIILTDLSSCFNEADRKQMKLLIELLQKRGMAFLLIDQDEAVLQEFSNQIYVLRKGRMIYCFEKDEFQTEQLAKILLRNTKRQYVKKEIEIKNSPPLLEFKNINTKILKDFSFSICKGEIVSLFDINSYCNEEILKLLQGVHLQQKGEIYLKQKLYLPKNIKQAIQKGICFIEENPTKKEGTLFLNLNGIDNLALILSQKVSNLFITKKIKNSIQKESEEYFTKEELSSLVSKLSPVQQQKLAYYKWLLYYPYLIVCVKPFSEVDFYMKQVTETMIRKFSEKKIAVLILTSNLSEAYTMGERVISLKNGKILEDFNLIK